MWWNVGPHLKRRMAYERGETSRHRQTYTYFEGETGKDDFLEILRRKYGTLTRAWRQALDADDSGLLDAREFNAAMDIIGFVGNSRSLWFNLDEDQSGYISLAEIDAEAAQALEKFRVQCVTAFGSMDAAWVNCLDKDHSGALTLPELEESLTELGYTDMEEVEYLFGLLRVDPSAFKIMKHEVLFLQKWEERKQKTMARSWRKGARWVNKDPYFTKEPAVIPRSWQPRKSMFVGKSTTPSRTPTPAIEKVAPCPQIGRASQRYAAASPSPSEPPHRVTITTPNKTPNKAWPDLEKQPNAYAMGNREAHLRELRGVAKASMSLAPTTCADIDESEVKSEISDYTDIVAVDQDKAWNQFKEYLISNYGSLAKAFDVMDTSGDGSIEREEWMHAVTRRLRYCRASEALRLFDSKVGEVLGKARRINFEDLGITRQEWIIYCYGKSQEEQKIKNRNVQMKPQAFGGEGLRRDIADEDHERRMKCKPKKPPEAFFTTLPKGWGFPPSYINFAATTEERKRKSRQPAALSARTAGRSPISAWIDMPITGEPQTARCLRPMTR
jgi:Ca2+-binding EF-hand superfamily protein